jgi:hypothetical protein
MTMKMISRIVLLVVGRMSGSHASTADSAVSMVRVQRAESNAAIEAHNAVRLRKLRSYTDEEFKDPTFVTYRRMASSIVSARSGKRVAEVGRWEGIWRKPMWIPSAGTWRLRSEAARLPISC